jgi:hypothetical protein
MRRATADHRTGHRHIHIELTEAEIHGLLADLDPKTLQGYEYALELLEVLGAARYDFDRTARRRR